MNDSNIYGQRVIGDVAADAAGSQARQWKIGDAVWYATWHAHDAYIECPDCGGTGRLRVTFHDETTVSIGCANCSPGYNPPTGRIKVYRREARADRAVITGLTQKANEPTEYSFNVIGGYQYYAKSECLFDSEADAMVYATQMADEADQAERDRALRKEKDTRTWAWNASYYRRQIKKAHQRIELYTAKLAVASLKAKGEKASRSEPAQQAKTQE